MEGIDLGGSLGVVSVECWGVEFGLEDGGGRWLVLYMKLSTGVVY